MAKVINYNQMMKITSLWNKLILKLFLAVCDKLDQNKSMFKKRYYRQDCRLEFQSYTKVSHSFSRPWLGFVLVHMVKNKGSDHENDV